ncbi:MAG TPA: transposase [Streptosporangiaceae bacterium]|nr:transposase [Streptosporangiaceae bacterium]
MAKGYRPVRRDQPFLFPPDMREWLAADHPVWLVIRAVGRMDTSAFHARRRTGHAGTAGYDPDMLVTLLVWAYAQGVASSRRMEALCGTDVAFRVICGGNLPDHVTIARFRRDFADAVTVLFGQVLILCARLGMGKLGTVALDGSKVRANASKAANRTEESLARLAAERAAAHAETDAAEDALFGDARGDEVPAAAADPSTRDERIDAALASARAERQRRERQREEQEEEQAAKAAQYLAAARAGTPKAGNPPAGTAVALAEAKVAREMAAQQAKCEEWERRAAAAAAAGKKPGGRGRPVPPEQYCRVRKAQAKLNAAWAREAGAAVKAAQAAAKDAVIVRNITDPDSRLMATRDGSQQCYNPQQVVSQDLLVIATELTGDPTDMAWFEPMMAQAEEAAALILAHQPAAAPASGDAPREPASGDAPQEPGSGIGLALADAGYLSRHNLTCPGPDRLIATGKRRDLEKTARDTDAAQDDGPDGDGPDDDVITAMAARLATGDGITAYRQRGHIAETPHGDIKHNMRFRQLSLRGKRKAAAEWRFACAVRNLRTAISSGHLTHDALDALDAPGPQVT